MIHTFDIPIAVTEDQCQSVLTNAADTGYIKYWELPFRKLRRRKDGTVKSFEVECSDGPPVSQPIDGNWALVDQHTVIQGLKRIIKPDSNITQYHRDAIIAMLGNKNDGIEMCDADQADCIIQFGLFGELVYG
jgi:hypothetical protein